MESLFDKVATRGRTADIDCPFQNTFRILNKGSFMKKSLWLALLHWTTLGDCDGGQSVPITDWPNCADPARHPRADESNMWRVGEDASAT